MSSLKALVEEELGSTITDAEMKRAEQRALQKLDWIISREGDANGDRLKPWYLVHLIAEAAYQYRLSTECLLRNNVLMKEKDCAAL